ncbi:hypothetical protein BB559_006296 [Furculomyces boomerangus]|uniref:Uncharacterized protein n=2 Tax=Harpellales TaxID=61421 RepID=A0A2T9Y3R2_9FUNG|nr:hypothetical protein BB559_006296 [Furculomyces boomerangus]PWA00069.1 hypothetical protein BB558_003881 [Smittium angustum]PWA02519.1 hypothetical protein BB558_001375 [Smittium angustum]
MTFYSTQRSFFSTRNLSTVSQHILYIDHIQKKSNTQLIMDEADIIQQIFFDGLLKGENNSNGNSIKNPYFEKINNEHKAKEYFEGRTNVSVMEFTIMIASLVIFVGMCVGILVKYYKYRKYIAAEEQIKEEIKEE